MKTTKKYYVNAVYRVSSSLGIDENVDRAIRIVAGECDGAGSGCFMRDMAWYNLSLKKAQEKAKKLNKLSKVKAEVLEQDF